MKIAIGCDHAAYNEKMKLINYLESKNIEVIRFGDSSKPQSVIDFIGGLENYLVIGVGNIVGWGEKLMKKLKEFKI